MACIHIVFAP